VLSLAQRGDTVPDPREFRLRYFLTVVAAAVLVAAVLRHVLHIYAGLTREDIRTDAVIAALVIGVAAVLLRRRVRR
jgi:uncharacterized membrane protein